MNLPCDNIHEAAKHLRNSYFDGFTLLPYSRFDAARSQFWWLLPEGINPAYHLQDPDSNGVELYRDRPPAEWPRMPEIGSARSRR